MQLPAMSRKETHNTQDEDELQNEHEVLVREKQTTRKIEHLHFLEQSSWK